MRVPLRFVAFTPAEYSDRLPARFSPPGLSATLKPSTFQIRKARLKFRATAASRLIERVPFFRDEPIGVMSLNFIMQLGKTIEAKNKKVGQRMHCKIRGSRRSSSPCRSARLARRSASSPSTVSSTSPGCSPLFCAGAQLSQSDARTAIGYTRTEALKAADR
jgi:hypothetical protein